METTTVVIQIGNSDDKLSQHHYSCYIESVKACLRAYHCKTHFSGGSNPTESWQNYCWVAEIENDPMVIGAFKEQLRRIRLSYKQNSVAILIGDVSFV